MGDSDPASRKPSGAAGPGAAAEGADTLAGTFDRIEKLLEFPVDFPIKVMGKRVDDFAQTVAAIVGEQVPGFDPAGMDFRSSAKGNYLSVSMTLRIESRAQLERLYRVLGEHPMVKVVL
jgi:uncharacterized protein